MLIMTSARTGTQRGTHVSHAPNSESTENHCRVYGQKFMVVILYKFLIQLDNTLKLASTVCHSFLAAREGLQQIFTSFHIQNGNFKTFSSIAEEGGISLQSFYMEGREKSLLCWFLSSILARGRWRQENKCSYLQLHLLFEISLGYMNLRLVWVT